MAHGITKRADGKHEMAYVGEVPWHKHGKLVNRLAKIEEWAVHSGMDWKALEAAPLFHAVGDKVGSLRSVSASKILYRSDTGEPLGIVGADYQVVQPGEVLEFFRDEVESGGWYIHTAGTLHGGRKLWAMASPNKDGKATVRGKDNIELNLVLATSLDGSMRTTAFLTAIRVVCQNTLRMSLFGAMEGQTKITVSHRSIFNPRAIKEALGLAQPTFEHFMEQARELAGQPIEVEEARSILRELFAKPSKINGSEEKAVYSKGTIDGSEFEQLLSFPSAAFIDAEVREQRSVQRTLELFQGEGMGASLASAKGTRWGLLNAVTEHIDHELGRTSNNRLDSAWFGRGDDVKNAAFKLLTA